MPAGIREPDETPTDEYNASQEEIALHSRDTGGDAPAAASLAEREELARGENPLFDDVEDTDSDGDDVAEGGSR